jgi:hypothetical protein
MSFYQRRKVPILALELDEYAIDIRIDLEFVFGTIRQADRDIAALCPIDDLNAATIEPCSFIHGISLQSG